VALAHVHDNTRIPERLALTLARLLDMGVLEHLAWARQRRG
jgi:hypothetical protein